MGRGDNLNKTTFLSLAFVVAMPFALRADIESFRVLDMRNIDNGMKIPSENYCDQPYVVTATNGDWVCVMTTGTGLEGQSGQHVVSCLSTNKGDSWSELVNIEPADGPEASWATPLIVPSGRIYVFYTYNGDQISSLPGSERRIRSDMLGWYCFKFSDDNGKSWSAKRWRVPLPFTACDNGNQWKGEVQIFWGVDKPKLSNGVVYFAFTKLGRYMLEQGEGWIVSSANILHESDPDKIAFKILPEGGQGIKSPLLGSVQEEFNLVPLDQGAMLCVNRTTRGASAHSYSRDNGTSWTTPVPMTYTPGGREMKNPRACPKLFKTSEGKYLLWYHNHGGTSFRNRNPGYISGGVLADDGFVHWSEPELVLFDSNPGIRISYPDLIENNGEFWLTETQKSTARVHKLDRSLLDGMWNQNSAKEVCKQGLLVEKIDFSNGVSRVSAPYEFGRVNQGGFSIECWFDVKTMQSGEELFDSIGVNGRGVRVVNLERDGKRILQIELCDGARITAWSSEVGLCLENQLQHVVFVCDYSAGIIAVILNGKYCDGGKGRQYGWGRIPQEAGSVNGAVVAELCDDVKVVRLYGRALRTSEAVANFRSGAAE